MRPLRYSINLTLDGCCHHDAGLPPDDESMQYWFDKMAAPTPSCTAGSPTR